MIQISSDKKLRYIIVVLYLVIVSFVDIQFRIFDLLFIVPLAFLSLLDDVEIHESIVFGLLTYGAWFFDRIYLQIPVTESGELYNFAILRLFETCILVALNLRIVKKNLRIKNMNRFLAIAAHDIRSPLASIKSGLEYTVDQKEYDDDFLKILISAADSSISYSTNILRLAQSGFKKLKPNLEKINTHHLINKIVSILDIRAKEKEISIKVRSNCKEVSLNADPVLFEQALLNVINNSIKFSPLKGEIFVESSRYEDYFEVTIIDQGSGIDNEHINNIKDAYQTGKKNENTGFGLGLYIVNLIMDAHNGKFYIQSPISASGTGTMIKLSFPVN